MNVSNIKDKLYFTYGEILNLILSNIFSMNNGHINTNYQIDIVEHVVIDINDAVEDRVLIPIIIDKPDSKIGDFQRYTIIAKIFSYIFVMFALITLIYHYWSDPKYKYEILKDNPKFDLLGDILKTMWIFLCAALVPYLGELYGCIKIFVLKANSTTSVGMIKYQIAEAKNRGYISAAYHTDSVVKFLESKYGIKIDPNVYETPNGNGGSPEWYKTPKNQYSQDNQQLLQDIGLLKIIFKPLKAKKDKELSEKMRRVANAGHAPLQQAKENIELFIRREIPPPCTCYHNQICAYIIENQKKEGFEAPLTYFNKYGEVKKISKEILMDMAKNIMKLYDPSRVCDRPIKLEPCEKHQIK
jgi:hypothetical protein